MDAIFIAAGIDSVCHGRIIKFLQHFLGAGQPSVGLDDDERRGIIGSLKHIACAETSDGILQHDLGVLSAGLRDLSVSVFIKIHN